MPSHHYIIMDPHGFSSRTNKSWRKLQVQTQNVPYPSNKNKTKHPVTYALLNYN